MAKPVNTETLVTRERKASKIIPVSQPSTQIIQIYYEKCH